MIKTLLLALKELKKSLKYNFLGDIYLFCENCRKITIVDKEKREELGIKRRFDDYLKFLRCDCGATYGKKLYQIDPLKE
ncbi:MAG: hypothetical protein QXL86_00140 [Candidatus Aenigmatarchaeota archaeon]